MLGSWCPGWKPLVVLTLLLVAPLGCATLPAELLELLQEQLALAGEPDVYVNLQIDAEREDVDGLTAIANELIARGIRTTVFVTADYANQNALLINELYARNFEIALHGFYTGEQLASLTYAEQLDLLTRAKVAVEGCQPCGTYKPVFGFRPQYFSQNDDTFQVLSELGLTYDCGFKAGQIYVEGHEQDTTPYPIDDYGLQAVPVTTVEYEGEVVYLCDIACALVNEMSAEQWREVLQAGFQQALANGDPLVIILHGWYTGDQEQYDYWQPFVDFLDEIEDQAGFISTQELVNLYAN